MEEVYQMIKAKNKIFFIALNIIIVLLNLFVGSSHTEPRIILETIILIIGIIFIIIKKYKESITL